MDKHYFGFSESIEFSGRGSNKLLLVQFDAFPVEEMKSLRPETLHEDFLKLNTFTIWINMPVKKSPQNFIQSWSELEEGSWFDISTEELSRVDSEVYAHISNFPQEDKINPISINTISYLPQKEGIGKLLSERISLDQFKSSNRYQLEKLLGEKERDIGLSPMVFCLNVGQGSCNAICNEQALPHVYFDFGCGYGQNKHTYNEGQRYCFINEPLFVLSHWDKDHWCLAEKENDALRSPWIVPYQTIGASQMKFATKLFKNNNLFIWRNGIGRSIKSNNGIVEVKKCTGKYTYRHHSGLAMTVKSSTSMNEEGYILLPGDAPYDYIHGIKSRDIIGLVATHHGGKFSMKKEMPYPKNISCQIIYSYGIGNSYGHPVKKSIDKHCLAGWKNRKDTPNGHAVLGGKSGQPPFCCIK